MIRLELAPEVETQLNAQAIESGVPLVDYVQRLLAQVASRPLHEDKQRAVSDAIDRLRELRKGNYLTGLKIKDLIHEGHKSDAPVRH